jgi:Mg-chelatase subunit ChlD
VIDYFTQNSYQAITIAGSMKSDNKLTFAKKAISSVLNLFHDDDLVHLVAYDTDVLIIFENSSVSTRQFLHSVINEIKTVGSTNLSDGLEVGGSLIDKYSYTGFTRRIFIFSNGKATVGLRKRDKLTKLVAGYYTGGAKFFHLESAQVIEPLVNKAL